MDENFLITINGTQIVDKSDDEVSLQTLGSYEIEGGKKVIKYYEYDEEFPEMKALSTIVIDEDNVITFIKDGNVKSQLILQKGKRHVCFYITQFGMLNIGTYTDLVKINLDQNGGEIHAEYVVDINSSVTSKNKINIIIKKVGENHV